MVKNDNIKLILFPILVVVLLAVILIFCFIKGHPKTPATEEQVFNTLESNGYATAELTSEYQEKWNIGNVLTYAVATEQDDLRFDFFIFDNVNSAEYIRKEYQTYIRENRYTNSNIEITEGSTNYTLYTLKAKGMYTINMRVDNTLVFAYCNEENASKLNALMTDLGYFDE